MAGDGSTNKRSDIKGVQYTVPTGNRFESISDDGDEAMSSAEGENDEFPAKSRKVYCPPIVIRGQNFAAVNALLKTNGFTSRCNLKLSSFGYRIQANDENTHKELLDVLNKSKIQYFSYQLRNEIPLRFVLSGLPKMEPTDIKKELIDNELNTVIDVVSLPLKNKRYDDHSIYIVKFENKSVSIHQLKKVKYLFNIVVRWETYRRRKMGPMICARCQHFGHVAANCNLQPRCGLCGENHATSSCTKDQNNLPENLKCCNCEGNHRPISDDCKKKQEFIDIQLKLSRRQHNSSLRKTYKQFETRNYNAEFPQLRSPLNSGPIQFNNSNHLRSNPNQPSQSMNGIFNENSERESVKAKSGSLFTYAEITNIVCEIVDEITQCNSKADQLKVITRITLKYLSHYD